MKQNVNKKKKKNNLICIHYELQHQMGKKEREVHVVSNKIFTYFEVEHILVNIRV